MARGARVEVPLLVGHVEEEVVEAEEARLDGRDLRLGACGGWGGRVGGGGLGVGLEGFRRGSLNCEIAYKSSF